jgi:hypothetical protein
MKALSCKRTLQSGSYCGILFARRPSFDFAQDKSEVDLLNNQSKRRTRGRDALYPIRGTGLPYGEERWTSGGAVSDYTFTGQRVGLGADGLPGQVLRPAAGALRQRGYGGSVAGQSAEPESVLLRKQLAAAV